MRSLLVHWEGVSVSAKYHSLLFAIVSFVIGLLLLIFPPYDLMTEMRLRLSPGSPMYSWWLHPPVDIIANIYLFNITNAKEFLDGVDRKMKVEEVGPITYREKLYHTNPVFNENGTFSYTSKRELMYYPKDNPNDLLNATIVMPNLAALFLPTYVYDSSFVVKFAVNTMMRKYDTKVLTETTVYDFLWNTTDPMIDVARTLAPGLFPIKNVGIMARIYANLESNLTVYIGPKYDGSKYFQIDKYDGSVYLPKRIGTCDDKIEGAMDDNTYHMNINKNETLKFYGKAICRVMQSKFVREVNLYGLKAYRFEIPETFFGRTFPEEKDCYRGSPKLPNGLVDCGACYFGTSVSASFPHFLHGDETLKDCVEGMNPSREKHGTYVIVEPTTGLPLKGATRLQMVISVKDMTGFNKTLQKFSNLAVPLCWVEYTGDEYPWHLIWLLYTYVMLLPTMQVIVPCTLLLVGPAIIYLHVRREKRKKIAISLMEDQVLREETNEFLTKDTKNNKGDFFEINHQRK